MSVPAERAQVVVVGAGIAGASIAYHLARLGVTDVIVLDQGRLVGGTTSHAPGLVGQLRSSPSLTRMLMYSVSLYRTLALDGQPGFQETGSLRIASSPQRWSELQRQDSVARAVGLDAHLLGPDEIAQMVPLLNMAGVVGALYIPRDGSASATILARAMIDDAQQRGVRFLPQSGVVGLDVERGRIRRVQTDKGEIAAEAVVVAAGIWSRLVARLAGVSLPLVPMQHQYVVTPRLPELKGITVPNVRDPDRLVYLRQQGEALVVGGYERDPRVFSVDGIPKKAEPTLLPFDAAQFRPLSEAMAERVPAFARYGVEKRVNGLEAFTPDGEFLLGPAPDIAGLWVACGFCAHGVSGAGGVGKELAEWIVVGEPSLDLWHMDVRRIGGYAGARDYVEGRAAEVYRTYYDVSHPWRERSSVRNLRLSPVHPELVELGAVFGEKAGWERPNWFGPNKARAPGPHGFRGWGTANWSAAIAAEHLATRERAALFDVTSFSKLEVGGPGSLALLQRLADNQMDKPVGSITYTQLLNERGGIECDLTVTRLAEDRFMLVTGAAFGGHDLSWIRRHMPDDGRTYARDITSSLCAIGLWGPEARHVLEKVTDADVSSAAFPYLTAQQIGVGPIPVLALRVTYVGELGWELYAPAEYGLGLWRALWKGGQEFGLLAGGYRAIDSLRLEKGYRYWSADITAEDNPYEAGLGFAVRLNKGDFVGREALLAARERGLRRRLCCLTLADTTAVAMGNEAVLKDERVVGRITSGGYGYSLRQSIAYAYLPVTLAEPDEEVEVLWFGERIPAVVRREPLYDPTNKRVKA